MSRTLDSYFQPPVRTGPRKRVVFSDSNDDDEPSDATKNLSTRLSASLDPNADKTGMWPIALCDENDPELGRAKFDASVAMLDVKKLTVVSSEHPGLKRKSTRATDDPKPAKKQKRSNPTTDLLDLTEDSLTQCSEVALARTESLRESRDPMSTFYESQGAKWPDKTDVVLNVLRNYLNAYEGKLAAAIDGLNREGSEKITEFNEKYVAAAEDMNALLDKYKDIPTVRRAYIVKDFLRPPVPEAGERPCSNGQNCASVAQFCQMWYRDHLCFEKTWGLSLRSDGVVVDDTNAPFGGFCLREFLVPSEESKRKTIVEAEMIKRCVADDAEEENRDTDQRADLCRLANPGPPGLCILCNLKTTSRLTARLHFASNDTENVTGITQQKPLFLGQTHVNLFGIPNEYRLGCEMRRGSTVCELKGPITEYNLRNYLPEICTVNYSVSERTARGWVRREKDVRMRCWTEAKHVAHAPEFDESPSENGVLR